MSDDRKSGIALIAGSVGGILTMAIHPTSAATLPMAGPAHSLAIASMVLLFLGACGLSRRIAARDRISFAALITFGFACVGIFIAAGISGFVVPDIMKHMSRDAPAAAGQWHIVVDGIFQINQAFARIYSVASSAAIILWSISALRNGGLRRSVAIYGCVIAPLIILAITVGHLRLDVHGMAIVGLAQVIWFILVGSQLCSASTSGVSPQ